MQGGPSSLSISHFIDFFPEDSLTLALLHTCEKLDNLNAFPFNGQQEYLIILERAKINFIAESQHCVDDLVADLLV